MTSSTMLRPLILFPLLLTLGCGDDDPASTDHSSRDTSQDLAQWHSCLATPKAYEPFEDSISTIGRIQGYESIADLLWRKPSPTPDDFTQANLIYVTEEGLDSRVSRREDEHFPPVTDAAGQTLQCRDEGVPARDPERCVGPATLRPALLEALTKGANGEDSPTHLATRIEANLQWFLVISVYKEARTCIDTKKDCDSSYAYYTGGDPTGLEVGLAKAVSQVDMAANQSVLRAIQGLGCWRTIDGTDTAQNTALADRATAYLDDTLFHAASTLMLERLKTAPPTPTDWTWVQTFGRYLAQTAGAKTPANAGTLSPLLAPADPADADVPALKAQLMALFPPVPLPTASTP